MIEMRESHQQQLHQLKINLAHMVRNAVGSASVPTTISTMTQIVSPSLLVFSAAGYMAPVVHVPPAASDATATTRRDRGRRAGFGAAP